MLRPNDLLHQHTKGKGIGTYTVFFCFNGASAPKIAKNFVDACEQAQSLAIFFDTGFTYREF